MPSAACQQTLAARPGAFHPALRAGLQLQRKCACGSPAPSLTGECTQCQSSKLVQARLAIGASNDPFEKEADRVADQVLAAPANVVASAAPLRIQRVAGQESAPAAPVPANVDRVLASAGSPLEPALRHDMQQRFGHDFSRVRVHSGTAAGQSALDVNANAYTVSNDIVFGVNRFAPETSEGRRLLAHELTHVVQQSGSAGGIARIQRQLAGCQSLIPAPPQAMGVGMAVHQAIESHFTRSATGVPKDQVRIPGASAAPGRTQGLCGRDENFIKPQMLGGKAGDGLPDLARIGTGGVLQVAEIKPATEACLIDGEEQLSRYISQGNERDAAQVAWRSSLGIKAVSPLLPSVYSAPTLTLGRCQVRTAWCTAGLLGYAVSCPRQQDDDDQPLVPPVFVRPGDQPSQTEGKGDGKSNGRGDGKGKGDGKGNGDPGKGNDRPNDRGKRTPGRDQPQQPTFMMPGWVPGTAILAILGAIVAWGSRTLPGKIAATFGTLLGRLALALGLSLGFFGGTGTATAGGSKNGGTGGPPKAGGAKTAGKDSVMVPGDSTTVPGGTVTVPRPDRTRPLTDTVDVPVSTQKPKTPPKKGGPAVKAAKKAQHIILALIEGLNLGKLTPGKLAMVEIDPGGPNEKVVLLKTKRVNTRGGDVTAEFESLLFECGQKGKSCDSGGNIYTVTHPYRGGDAPALVAHAIREFGDMQGMDQTLDAVEQLLRP